MMPLMMGGQQAQNMNWFNIGNNNNNNNPIGLLSTNSSTSSSMAANPFIGDQSLSSLMMITRGIKTTSKKDETYVEVFDPEYINEKKPKGPETAEEFADVSSQKV